MLVHWSTVNFSILNFVCNNLVKHSYLFCICVFFWAFYLYNHTSVNNDCFIFSLPFLIILIYFSYPTIQAWILSTVSEGSGQGPPYLISDPKGKSFNISLGSMMWLGFYKYQIKEVASYSWLLKVFILIGDGFYHTLSLCLSYCLFPGKVAILTLAH